MDAGAFNPKGAFHDNDALKTILVVDDDPVVGRSFDRVLSPKGYAVISATSGAEALERLEAEKYDMVYTDIKMPGMDGIEVAKRIKASRPWLPVVIVTGYGTEANEAEARAAGVAEFLHKPLSPETIEGQRAFRLLGGRATRAGRRRRSPAGFGRAHREERGALFRRAVHRPGVRGAPAVPRRRRGGLGGVQGDQAR